MEKPNQLHEVTGSWRLQARSMGGGGHGGALFEHVKNLK